EAARDRPITHLHSCLYQTERNLALDHLRNRSRRARIVTTDVAVEQVLDVPSVAPPPDEVTRYRQLLAYLEATLDALPDRRLGLPSLFTPASGRCRSTQQIPGATPFRSRTPVCSLIFRSRNRGLQEAKHGQNQEHDLY
ncbi:MAG: RNA polymerase sigma factor, partial [Nitrospirales bacterium]